MTINTKKVVEYWFTTAAHNYETAKFLLKGKRYPECLFFCHLMIEKVLKALIVQKTKTHALYTHKLVDLVKFAKIDLSPEQIEDLTTITGFNIAARYNEVKFEAYKRFTKKYTEKYFLISKKLYLWLKKQVSLKK